MTTTPDPTLLLAREYSARLWEKHGLEHAAAQTRVGNSDTGFQVQTFLAAIRETTELAYRQCLKMDGALNNSGACAAALRANRHLEKGSTDDQP